MGVDFFEPNRPKVPKLSKNPGTRRTNPSTARASIRHHRQVAHPNQVEGRHGQDKLVVQLLAADEPALAHPTDRLRPAEAFLDALTKALAGGVAGVAGGASVNR